MIIKKNKKVLPEKVRFPKFIMLNEISALSRRKIELEKPPIFSACFQNSRHSVKANSAKESGKTIIPPQES